MFEFHSRFSLTIHEQPTIDVTPELIELRLALIEEEVSELRMACQDRNLIAVADALADSTYVLYGAAIAFGIDLDAVIREVHRSNMSKLDRDGTPVFRADGKVMKGPDYSPPNVARVLATQSELSTILALPISFGELVATAFTH